MNATMELGDFERLSGVEYECLRHLTEDRRHTRGSIAHAVNERDGVKRDKDWIGETLHRLEDEGYARSVEGTKGLFEITEDGDEMFHRNERFRDLIESATNIDYSEAEEYINSGQSSSAE